jgi:ATP-dependent DNA helicase RecQ
VKKRSVEKIAREKFDFPTLRPGQKEAIESIVSGRDTLVVMPTGAGKSAVYQIAAQILNGPAVIVSPLIALQKDQVDALEEQDVGGAAVINSSISATEQEELLEELEEGGLEYTFVTPEQLSKPEVLDRIRDAEPALFVVDEAHCISEWGHDFRPDYLNLGRAIGYLGHPRVLALTATATGRVRDEIVQRLGMRDPAVFVHGFDRPNIWLGVNTAPNDAAKRELLIARVEDAEKPGIVYVASRRHAEEVAAELSSRGVDAVAYHGGMTPKQRAPIQDDFMAGKIPVIVATSAFGMGVDKPHVRFVFHLDIPHSIDAYYQEIGRAGRDGEPARALLFYRPEDLAIQKFFAGSAKAAPQRLEKVALAVLEEADPVPLEALQEKTELSSARLKQTLNKLEEAGAVEVLPTGEVTPAADPEELHEITEEAAVAQSERHEAELERIERMRIYAELNSCRREYLLSYFGEESPERCGNCDVCLQPEAAKPREKQGAPPPPDPIPMRVETKEEDLLPFAISSRVTHTEWGRGVVKEYAGDKIIVRFDKAGLKTLLLEAVLKNGLLQRVG